MYYNVPCHILIVEWPVQFLYEHGIEVGQCPASCYGRVLQRPNKGEIKKERQIEIIRREYSLELTTWNTG